VNALAKPEVGQYLNEHFVAAFQKVATFKIVNGQKQGGNVASYFCTPDGRVLQAVAGPVDGATLLREARWVVETYNLADLDGKGTAGLKAYFGQAHADRLYREHGFQSMLEPRPDFTAADVAEVLDRGRGLDNPGRIDLLLSTYPLAPIGKVYRPIFERLLNEPVSTSPVLEGAAARDWNAAPATVVTPTAEDERQARLDEKVLRARDDPPQGEVQSGAALNLLLADLRRLDGEGVAPAKVGLDAAALAHIRLVADGDGEVGPSLALQDPLPWPESLLTDDFAADRARVEAALAVARQQAAKGAVARDAGKAAIDAAERMDQRITAKVQGAPGQPTWSASDAIEAASFLDDFKTAAAVFQRPDVSSYLNGAYAAKGGTVGELVRNMASKGLRFAPALPGDESAYAAVRRALASCDAKAYAAGE